MPITESGERLLWTVLNTVREGVLVIDATGTVVLTNQAAARIWGYTQADLIGRHLELLLAERCPAIQMFGVQHYQEYDICYFSEQRIEFKGQRKDKTIFPLEAFVKAVSIDGRRLFIATVHDLSTHRWQERLLAVQYAVNHVLTKEASLSDVASKLLQAIGEHFEWELGALWSVSKAGDVLHCTTTWHAPSVTVAGFDTASRQLSPTPGVGLPGRVWLSGQAIWVTDILTDDNFLRRKVAALADLHSALAFPIRGHSGVLGILEFFCRDVRPPDQALVQVMTALGNQIVQFLERKRAEEAVRGSEARKRAILEASLDCIITIDHHGKVTEWNPAAEQVFGYSRAEALGRELAELIVPPSLRDSHRRALARYLATGESSILGKHLEMLAMRADGSCFPSELAIARIPSEGPPIFTGFIRDITERKQAEEALRAREQQQAAVAGLGQRALAGIELLTLMDEAVRLVAETLGVEYCKVLELLPDGEALLLRAGVGWQEGLVGQALVDAGAGSQAGYTLLANSPVIVEDLRSETRFAGPPLLHEHGVVSGLGVIIPGRARGFGVLGAHTSVRRRFKQDDVSFLQAVASVLATAIERKRAEEALRENEEQLRLLVEGVKDYAICMLDPEGHIISWNPGGERIMGYRTAEIVGRPMAWFYPAEEVARGKPGRDLQVAATEGRFEEEGWRVRQDGVRVWADTVIAALYDNLGALRGFVTVARDITERKKAEETLQQYTQRLQHLRALDRAILAVQSPEEMSRAALRRMRQLVPWQWAAILLFDVHTHKATVLAMDRDGETIQRLDEQLVLEERLDAIQWGSVQLVDDSVLPANPVPMLRALKPAAMRWSINLPLSAQDQLIGVLSLATDTPDILSDDHVDIAREVADHLALTIQQARLFEQIRAGHNRLRSLSRQLLATQENERRRIARELHDQIGQALTVVQINLLAVQRISDPSALAPILEETTAIIESVLRDVRDLSLDLRPSLLDDLGLVSALRWYADRLGRRSGFAVRFSADPIETRLPAELETTCFRVAQEALTNVLRYAQAHAVEVAVRCDAGQLQLVIRDDGVGFDVAAAQERAARGMSLGLLGMHERVALVGGQIAIESAPQQGTEVRVSFGLAGPCGEEG